MLLAVFERAALMLMTLFLPTRTRPFQRLFQKRDHTPPSWCWWPASSACLRCSSTYTGIPVEGALINVRIIAIISGGILFGPGSAFRLGSSRGCTATSSTWTVTLLFPVSSPASSPVARHLAAPALPQVAALAVRHPGGHGLRGADHAAHLAADRAPRYRGEIVSHIAYPMIAGTLCIGLIIKLVQDLDDEKELIAAKRAKLALDIANKTLPFFQNIDRHSLGQVCGIIRSEISADAVAITDTRDVLAYVGWARTTTSWTSTTPSAT